MGPRSGDRGNLNLLRAVARKIEELQWGRDLVIAEITDNRAADVVPVASFNGAAIW